MNIMGNPSASPKEIDRNSLVEYSSIKLNPNATKEQRLKEYISQIKNPYCYLDGKTVVKITFSDTKTTLEDCIAHYLKGL